MRPAIARWSAACALLAWATGAAADGAGPALWSIAGERNTVYLFGSVHLLRDGEFRLEGTLSDAYEDAEAVYFEVDMDDLDPVQAAAATAALALDPQGRGLIELMGPEADALRERAATADVDLAGLFRVRPSAEELLDAQMTAAERLGRPVDLVDLDDDADPAPHAACGL